jgi:NADPH:quinone reductase-like Zn-dependent oxidoreductase
MKAAVVTSFGAPPRFADFPAPVAAGEHELVVDVLAAGLHPPRLAAAAADVDVVLDYIWGEPAAAAMAALITARPDRGKQLTWVEIGSMAGLVAPIPSAALRAARFRIVGSGQGSVGTGEIIAALPGIAAAITDGSLRVDTQPVPLADVEAAWASAAESTQRIVLVPGR